jgi:hypothetical protein
LRFVSKYKRYVVWFQREIVEHFATGQSREIQPGLVCEFDLYGSMFPHEITAAREHFTNYGLPVEVDMVTHIDPLTRFSIFDTQMYQARVNLTDEKREELEEFLLTRPEYGTDYIMVMEPRVPAPWPNYDSFRGVKGLATPYAIAKKVQEDGYEADLVIAYERQNANRLDVIAALEHVGAPVVEPDESLIEA